MNVLVIGVLAALIGVVGGFLVARHVDRLGARRLAYTAYVGAVEVAGAALRRRLLAIRDHPERRPWPPMADAQRVNDTLGEMWTVALADMMRIVERRVEVAGQVATNTIRAKCSVQVPLVVETETQSAVMPA